jgi:phosphoribosylformylglycinamidine synthase
MAVVIEAKDVEEFISYCASENIEVNHVADVTAEARLVMNYKGETIVNISREFIDSAGAKHYAQAEIEAISTANPFVNKAKKTIKNIVKETLSDNNVVSQKGLIEMFDATIGTSTVLMPFGGKYQKTETQVSCQKLPVLNAYTNTASIMAYGYNPFITKWSPFHGSQYAIIEAISKVVAAGARYDKMRFSYQEYFEKMNNVKAWGKPLAALLGALKMQLDFNLPSIGGKDSMSGTYNSINVPPMLMAFGITTVNANNVISPEFKKAGSKIYLIKHNELKNFLPNVEELKKNFDYVSSKIEDKTIISAYALGFGGVVEALAKMSLGNQIGFTANYPTCELNTYNYGSIVVETDYTLDSPNAVLLGYTTGNSYASINNVEFKLSYLEELICNKFNQVYKDKANNDSKLIDIKPYNAKVELLKNKDEVLTYIPVFPGTNCDYDTAKAFLRAGSKVKTSVFKNLTENDIKESIVEMAANIDACDIFVLSGGFSAGDEPDGSGKFIANVLNQETVKDAIHRLLDRKGLILGICNGFQALVKSGLLPYGRLGTVTKESPTLFRNDINRHVSQMVSTKVMTNASPWLASYNGGEVHKIAVSHGEGKFVVSNELAQELIANGQIAFQYVDDNNDATIVSPFNPNGSNYAIEGIISKDGLILGKMGHSERIEDNLYKNISGNKYQDIFKNAVAYFKK